MKQTSWRETATRLPKRGFHRRFVAVFTLTLGIAGLVVLFVEGSVSASPGMLRARASCRGVECWQRPAGYVPVPKTGLSAPGVASLRSGSPSGSRSVLHSRSATRAEPTPSTILRLAERGLGGNYEATYRITGKLGVFPGPQWTVVVAHRGRAPSLNWLSKGDNWSFFLRAGRGFSLQWIEEGDRYDACWRRSAQRWVCGKGTYYPSNSCSLSIVPYVPGEVVGDIRDTLSGSLLSPGEHQRLSTSTRPDARFGELSCLTASTWFQSASTGGVVKDRSSATWCLTRQGLAASEIGRGDDDPIRTWTALKLVSLKPHTPTVDFMPKSSQAVHQGMPPIG